jgi:hypothetical protein
VQQRSRPTTMNRTSGTCGTEAKDLTFVTLKSQKERRKKATLKTCSKKWCLKTHTNWKKSIPVHYILFNSMKYNSLFVIAFVVLRQSLIVQPRLAWHLLSSCSGLWDYRCAPPYNNILIILYFFLWYWDLNLGLCDCYAGTLLFETCPLPL